MFLMRCLFTMFAEDVGLLPKASFRQLLERCEQDPAKLQPMVGQLWEAMDRGDFAIAIEARVKRFNGEFFKTRTVLPLAREEIGELRQAASSDWREVDPRSSARCWNRRSIRASDGGSARITRRAPMSSGWSSRRSSNRCAPIGIRRCRRRNGKSRRVASRMPWRRSARSTTRCARRASSIRPAAPAISCMCRWSW
jgi:hypothetical protein